MAAKKTTLRRVRVARALGLLSAGIVAGLVIGRVAVRDTQTSELACRALAALSVAGLLAGRWLPRRCERARDWVLAGLALCATWNFGVGHPATPEHPRDFAHYVLGARYFDEVRYRHLYECTVAAAEEHGLDTRSWLVRDLETGAPMTAERLRAGAAACPARFTPERWARFSADVWELNQRTGGAMLPGLQEDHGFNAPPPWLVLAGSIAEALGPWHGLVWFDAIFIALAAAAIFSAFGVRAMTLFLLFAACHAPNHYSWVGGSFFRLDWWAALALGFAALRFRRDKIAGGAFAYAALVRVFPVVIAVGVLLVLLRGGGRRWRGFLVGGFSTAVVLCGAAVALHGWQAFPESASNLERHASGAALNTMGWEQVVVAPGEARMRRMPMADAVLALEEWARRREVLAAERAPLRALGVLAVCVGWWFASKKRRAWTSVGLVPFVLPPLSCYYSVVLAFLAVGARANRQMAITLAAVVLTTTLVPTTLALDDYYAVQSLLDVQAIALAFLLTGRRAF